MATGETADTDWTSLNDLLDRRPEDWEARLVLADWYEENGDAVLAAGQRWQAKNRKRLWMAVFAAPVGVWRWLRARSLAVRRDPDWPDNAGQPYPSELDPRLFGELQRLSPAAVTEEPAGPWPACVTFRGRREAEAALAAALAAAGMVEP